MNNTIQHTIQWCYKTNILYRKNEISIIDSLAQVLRQDTEVTLIHNISFTPYDCNCDCYVIVATLPTGSLPNFCDGKNKVTIIGITNEITWRERSIRLRFALCFTSTQQYQIWGGVGLGRGHDPALALVKQV